MPHSGVRCPSFGWISSWNSSLDGRATLTWTILMILTRSMWWCDFQDQRSSSVGAHSYLEHGPLLNCS
jgi:hypothetical protein